MSNQETPDMLLYREQQKQQTTLHKGYTCDLCGGRGTDYHELIFRSSTLNNAEARRLSFQQELCALLCQPCHANAHNTTTSMKLLLKNIHVYGREAVENALEAVRDVLKGRLAIELPDEEVLDG